MSDERPETCARCGAPLVWCKCDGETSPTPTTREAAKEHAWNYSADEDDANSFYHGFDAGWSAALTVPAGKAEAAERMSMFLDTLDELRERDDYEVYRVNDVALLKSDLRTLAAPVAGKAVQGEPDREALIQRLLSFVKPGVTVQPFPYMQAMLDAANALAASGAVQGEGE